jgi:ATP-binding protein involved in chromosome partitioning
MKNSIAELTYPIDVFLGAIIISTPQDIALKDAIKGINMFRHLPVPIPILGMVQNMSLFVCPHCQKSTHIFSPSPSSSSGPTGVESVCAHHGIDFLGDIPLHARICDDADRGMPTVVAEPDSERAMAFMAIAESVAAKVGLSGIGAGKGNC